MRLRNLACVTGMASGRFCWLFGSDDAPGPGALRAVLDLIDAYPDAGGFQLGIRRLTRDMSEPIDLMPAEAACRIAISVPSLPTFTAGYQSLVSCSVENRGPVTLSSRMPHPVRLAARWFDGEGRFIAQGPRTPLLPSLRSGERRTIAVRIDPPFEAGEYELRISAVQELVAWFDDLDAANGWAGTVAVKGT